MLQHILNYLWFYGPLSGIVSAVAFIMTAMSFRRVVKTNEVHIVQTTKETKSYGKDTQNGNVYYAFPSWLPMLGVSVIVLPTSNFSIKIEDYEAYDVERLPFTVDLTAFFRVSESNLAAQRVSNFHDLQGQLEQIIKGAVRSILSSENLNNVLQIRSSLGDKFTDAIEDQLRNWGVEAVKTIELMDIRDSQGSNVIANIMSIKMSDIERNSRTEVARNMKEAEIAEITAKQDADMKRVEAEKNIGLKRVESERSVELSNQDAKQQIEISRKSTIEKTMEVNQVEAERQAEINKNVALINANKLRQEQEIAAEAHRAVQIKEAEAARQRQILLAEGQQQEAFLKAEADLETKTKEAKGVLEIGRASAEAKREAEIAAVAGQIALANEIGSNEGYQNYLIEMRKVEASELIGVEQAKAMTNADLKVIVNEGGSVNGGMNSLANLFTAKGGNQMGAMLSSLTQYPEGKQLVESFAQKLSGLNGNSNNVINQE